MSDREYSRPENSGRIFYNCLLSVDGTDCPLAEPYPFCKDWYSHKINGPGVRYEVGVSIYDGEIVWANGPFPAGTYPDLKIFRANLKENLNENECVISDETYTDYKCVRRGHMKNEEDYSILSNIKSRHENVNEIIKNFNILKTRFRHHQSLHSYCFHAVLRITQFVLKYETPLRTVI